jgi:hypothetical protein
MILLLKHELENRDNTEVWGTSMEKPAKHIKGMERFEELEMQRQMQEQNLYLKLVEPIAYLFQSKD